MLHKVADIARLVFFSKASLIYDCNVPNSNTFANICQSHMNTPAFFSCSRERFEENEQQNLAIMLMVVVLVFILCNILAMVTNLFDAFAFEVPMLPAVSIEKYIWYSQSQS